MFTDYFHYLLDLLNKEMVENIIYVEQSLLCISEVANVFRQLLMIKKKILVWITQLKMSSAEFCFCINILLPAICKGIKKRKKLKSNALLEERKFCTLIMLQMLNSE